MLHPSLLQCLKLLNLLRGHFHPLDVCSLVLRINWDVQACCWNRVLEPDIHLSMKGCGGGSAVRLGCLHTPLLGCSLTCVL